MELNQIRTDSHFLCASINDGPNILRRLRKFIKLNTKVFTPRISPDVFTLQYGGSCPYGALHIAARYYDNKLMIQEIIQLDPSSVTFMYKNHSYYLNYSLVSIGLFLNYKILENKDWKDVANIFLEFWTLSQDALVPLMMTEWSILHHYLVRNLGLKYLNIYVSTLLMKYPEVAYTVDFEGRNLLHILTSCSLIPNDFSSRYISLLLVYNGDMIKNLDIYKNLLIRTFVEYYYSKCQDHLAIFDILVSIYPESVSVSDIRGYSLLHSAWSDICFITMLSKRYPYFLRQQNNQALKRLHRYMIHL